MKKFEARIKRNVPLGPLNTLGIGGPAAYFAEADSIQTLIAATRWRKERDLNLLVIGSGSNLLVADSGFKGLVLKIALRGLDVKVKDDAATIRACAGEEWDRVAETAVQRGLAGIECISGVPGLVGATPIQNVGAYGQEVGDSIVEVEAVDSESGEPTIFMAADCAFGYRSSRFKTSDRGRYIIVSVTYRLIRDRAPSIRYPELRRLLRERGLTNPTLEDVRRTVIELRKGKGMIIDPSDADSRSAGSFFVNPTVTEEELEAIKALALARRISTSDLPVFPAPDGRLKIPAAWLIERSGFARGYRHGNAGLSAKHVLAIVNLGGATAREVDELASEIRLRVKESFGVELTPEPVFVGFDQPAYG